MANPLLWLGAYLALDRFRQQERRIAELEQQVNPLSEDQSANNFDAGAESSGCLGTLLLLVVASALLYALFFTIPGQIVLGIAAFLLLVFLVVKKSPWAIVLGIICGSVPIFSAHGMTAVLFFWGVAALIVFVVWKIFGRLF